MRHPRSLGQFGKTLTAIPAPPPSPLSQVEIIFLLLRSLCCSATEIMLALLQPSLFPIYQRMLPTQPAQEETFGEECVRLHPSSSKEGKGL